MTLAAILFTLACIGISETAYLIETRKKREKPVCFIGNKCEEVLGSKYNKIFLFHNDVWGLLFYLAIALLTAFLVIGISPLILWERLMKISVSFGALISLVLIYIQWQVIKAWCFWCLISAVSIWLMGFIILAASL